MSPTTSRPVLEQRVVLEHGVVATLTCPADAKQVRGVVMVHGFPSQKDEVGDLYKRLAIALDARGIGSLRMDFRGFGESPGDASDTTVQSQLEDVFTADQFLRTLSFVDSARIGIVGFSLGGAVAILAAARNPLGYRSMVLWSSVGDLANDLLSSWGPTAFEEAGRNGITTLDLGWRTISLKREFFANLTAFHCLDDIKRHRGAILAIAGSTDPLARYPRQLVAQAPGRPKESEILEGGDHIFGVLGSNQTMANYIIEKTADWFEATL